MPIQRARRGFFGGLVVLILIVAAIFWAAIEISSWTIPLAPPPRMTAEEKTAVLDELDAVARELEAGLAELCPCPYVGDTEKVQLFVAKLALLRQVRSEQEAIRSAP